MLRQRCVRCMALQVQKSLWEELAVRHNRGEELAIATATRLVDTNGNRMNGEQVQVTAAWMGTIPGEVCMPGCVQCGASRAPKLLKPPSDAIAWIYVVEVKWLVWEPCTLVHGELPRRETKITRPVHTGTGVGEGVCVSECKCDGVNEVCLVHMCDII